MGCTRRRSGICTTGVPSPKLHPSSGCGLPCAEQSMRPPELLENSTRWGGSCMNTGPCRSSATLHTETQQKRHSRCDLQINYTYRSCVRYELIFLAKISVYCAAGSFEMFILHNILEEINLQRHHHENLKSQCLGSCITTVSDSALCGCSCIIKEAWQLLLTPLQSQ